MVTARRGRADDLDALMTLRRAVATEGIWIGAEVPLDEAGDRERFATTIAKAPDDPTGVLLVAVDDETNETDETRDVVVGHLAMQQAIGIVDVGMAVAGTHRGRGVGAALMATGIDWARSTGAHKVALQHWPWNRAAHALYERFGFVEEGYLRRHYRRKDGSVWDAVIMGLVLDHTSPGHERGASDPPRSAGPPV